MQTPPHLDLMSLALSWHQGDAHARASDVREVLALRNPPLILASEANINNGCDTGNAPINLPRFMAHGPDAYYVFMILQGCQVMSEYDDIFRHEEESHWVHFALVSAEKASLSQHKWKRLQISVSVKLNME